MIRILRYLLAVAVAVALVFTVGCGEPNGGSPVASGVNTQARGVPAITPATPEEHAHKASVHGGIVVPIGRDNYHAEAVFEKDGVLRLYTLGNDEAKVIEVEAQPLSAYVKPDGGTEATSFVFKPEPQPGDAPGRTSQFLGKLPRDLWGKKVEVTIPTIRIGEERFRLGFKSAEDAHAETMPSELGDEDERKLYLSPGGLYTEADITANGGMTASEKFRGRKPAHDLKPTAGDKICPITLTKANPQFSWTIGGKVYEFCCPPCVDEFVKLAKEKPQEVKDPETYRKK